MRTAPALVALVALTSAAGCGGGGSHGARPAQPVAATGPYLGGAQLERELGSGFRDGLYRVAVMTQKSDDAADLGQALPTGLVERVSCAQGPATSSWRCSVRWRDVERHRQLTRYAVRLRRGGCFSAGAVPQRPQLYDATIRAYGEDPLNGIVSVKKGC